MPKLNEMKAKPGKPAQTGKLRSIRIEFKSNGFEVTVDRAPDRDKNNNPIYDYENPKDSMVFTEPGECLAHVEKMLGGSEHAAHEKAEGHPEAAKEAKPEAKAGKK